MHRVRDRSRAQGDFETRWLLAASAVAVMALLATLAYWLVGVGDAPKIESIAVLPLENMSGDPEQEYFSDGLTDALINELAQIGSIKVISRTSVMQYKGTRTPLPEIAKELNVEGIVEGSVLREGERVAVTAQLIDAAKDEHLWSQSFERDLRDFITLRKELAQAIAAEIRAELTPEMKARLAERKPVNPQAQEAFLKAMWYTESICSELYRVRELLGTLSGGHRNRSRIRPGVYRDGQTLSNVGFQQLSASPRCIRAREGTCQ